MDYKELYTDALERARELSKTVTGANYEYIFPELKESEDQRMKKAIMHVLYENYTDAAVIEGVEIAEIVAWLEEQSKHYHKREIDDAYLKGIFDAKHEIEKQGKTLDPVKVIAWLVANIIDFEYYVKLFKKDFGL